MNNEWDCIIVGGGAAGLSAALVLGRARRRTLVLDEGDQSNLAAHGIGGLLGHDGRPPAQLYEAGRAELAEYPNVTFRSAQVSAAKADGPGFVVELADGGHEHARRILLATGMQYRPPQVRDWRCSGAVRLSTARSAMAGRFVISRWLSSPMGTGPCTWR